VEPEDVVEQRVFLVGRLVHVDPKGRLRSRTARARVGGDVSVESVPSPNLMYALIMRANVAEACGGATRRQIAARMAIDDGGWEGG
jgi:hypothetical protein